MERVAVRVTVDGNGLHSQLFTGADRAQGNFTTVRDQYLFEHFLGRFAPYRFRVSQWPLVALRLILAARRASRPRRLMSLNLCRCAPHRFRVSQWPLVIVHLIPAAQRASRLRRLMLLNY